MLRNQSKMAALDCQWSLIIALSCCYTDPPYTLYKLAASFHILPYTLFSICKERAEAFYIIHVQRQVHLTVYCIFYFLLPITAFVAIISSNRHLYVCEVHS